MDINEYFDLAKKKLNLESDYAFCKTINFPRGYFSQLRSGKRNGVDEYLIFQLAEILDLDPSQIIVDLKSQSEKNPEKRKFWLSKLGNEAIRKVKGGLIKLRIMEHIVNKKNVGNPLWKLKFKLPNTKGFVRHGVVERLEVYK